jgi:glutamate racemase
MKTVANQYNVHPGFVREEHKINNVSTRSPEDKAKATQQFNNVENLLKSYPERNVGKFFNPGGLEQGVHALAAAENVMLSTGFNVEEGMPETDGPPGLAALAHALILCGKTVTFVADSKNNELVRDCLAELDKGAAERCKFEDFNVRPDAADVPENAEDQTIDQATKLREAELKAEKKAQDLLDQHKPDVFLSLELNGRGDSGYAKNMRGKVITGWNSMSDEVLNQANAKGVTTIAVGDGGNEAGMGGLHNIPNAMDGKPMQARTQAGIQVTSWNSNFGGEALAYGLLASYGKLRDKEDGNGNIVAGAGHTPEQQTAMIQAVLNGGGVDGVTRGKVLNEKSLDSLGRAVHTGVDGFTSTVHNGMLEVLRNISVSIPADQGLIDKAAAKQTEEPFLVVAFDSSAGGLVAVKNVQDFVKYRSNHNVQFMILTDFGNAPYGSRERGDGSLEPGTLTNLVNNGLLLGQKLGAKSVVMACNTACVTFPDSLKDMHIPVINLIETTARSIAEFGGAKPVVLSTEATAKDDMYKNRIRQAALDQGRAAGKEDDDIQLPTVVRVGAGDRKNEPGKDWASCINSLMHLSQNPKNREEMERVIKKYVNEIPKDASSVWLCCTHYPAIKDLIEQEMVKQEKGNIKVIDPMEHQADALIKQMDAMVEASKKGVEDSKKETEKEKEKEGAVDSGSKNTLWDDALAKGLPIVITSGRIAEATNATKSLLAPEKGAAMIQTKFNGQEFTFAQIRQRDTYHLKKSSQSSFDLGH